jgi:excisionase family DNA binding protein
LTLETLSVSDEVTMATKNVQQFALPFDIEPLVRVATAAEILDVAVITIRRWIVAGRLHPIKVGRTVRLRVSELKRITQGL